MARLGPFGPAPRFALAVSGGADSGALAELARGWAAAAGATLIALIADHGLRAGSAAEAALTAARLNGRGMATRIIQLYCLPGPALQERARAARYAALAQAARQAGCVFLLLGHHAGDQAETVAMRRLRGPGGAEGMAAWAARQDVVLLRPLLGFTPANLRAFLRLRGIAWIEDPSNADPRFERVRLRTAGHGSPAADSTARRVAEHEAATFMANQVTMRPEGFAIIAAGAAPAPALAALLRTIGGREHAPRRASVAALAARLRPATLGGVQIIKTADGWLLAREAAACAPPVAAEPGALWDRRFRLTTSTPSGSFGALGADAAAFRKTAGLPSVVLRAMPCLRPAAGGIVFPAPAAFAPPRAATSHPFLA